MVVSLVSPRLVRPRSLTVAWPAKTPLPSTARIPGGTAVTEFLSPPSVRNSSKLLRRAVSNTKLSGSTPSTTRNSRTKVGPPSALLPLAPAAVSSSNASRLPPWLIALITLSTSAPPANNAESVASDLSVAATSASTVSVSLARKTRDRPSSVARSTRLFSAARITSPSKMASPTRRARKAPFLSLASACPWIAETRATTVLSAMIEPRYGVLDYARIARCTTAAYCTEVQEAAILATTGSGQTNAVFRCR